MDDKGSTTPATFIAIVLYGLLLTVGYFGVTIAQPNRGLFNRISCSAGLFSEPRFVVQELGNQTNWAVRLVAGIGPIAQFGLLVTLARNVLKRLARRRQLKPAAATNTCKLKRTVSFSRSTIPRNQKSMPIAMTGLYNQQFMMPTRISAFNP